MKTGLNSITKVKHSNEQQTKKSKNQKTIYIKTKNAKKKPLLIAHEIKIKINIINPKQ